MDRFAAPDIWQFAASSFGRQFANSWAAKNRTSVQQSQPWTTRRSGQVGSGTWQAAGSRMGNSPWTSPTGRYGGGGSYVPPSQRMGSQVGAAVGGMLGGDTAGSSGHAVDQANPFVTAASQKFGVPTGVLKAIIVRESSGDWAGNGNRFVDIGRSSGSILPYVGIFEDAWSSWGCPGSAAQAVGNQQAQVDCLAQGMAMWYQRAKAANPSYDWSNVASMHFSGHYVPNGWADENGMTDTQYVSSFMKDVQRFSGTGGLGGSMGGAVGGAPSAGIATVWGGSGSRDLSYGFQSPSGSGIYSYGRKYGLPSGNAHTGIDIPDAPGAPIYTPVAGRVVCACTGSGGGCASFNDTMGPGCGRIEVELANRHRIIFGHSGTSKVRVGDIVQPGQQVGTVGGMNGWHTHLEYRIPDGSTASGYRIVDPNQYLGGAVATAFGAPQSSYTGSGFGGPTTSNYWSGNARRSGYSGYWSGSR